MGHKKKVVTEDGVREFSHKVGKHLKKELRLLHVAFADPFSVPYPWANPKRHKAKSAHTGKEKHSDSEHPHKKRHRKTKA